MQEHCILLACATGQNPDEMAHQNQMLKAGFITYLAQKQAAGIANPSSTNPAQVCYFVHNRTIRDLFAVMLTLVFFACRI